MQQHLLASNAALEADLEALQAQCADGISKLKNPDKNGEDTVRRHIELLHEYNEVKDVAMGLMGLVADNRGVPVGVVLKGGPALPCTVSGGG